MIENLIRYDLIPLKNRLGKNSHDHACSIIDNSIQGLETSVEVLITWLSKNPENLSKADKLIISLTSDSYQSVVNDTVDEIVKTVIYINKMRKFLTVPHIPRLSLAFIRKETIYPYYYYD